eukprot:360913-Chlamydomonas_euryale.AAC.7
MVLYEQQYDRSHTLHATKLWTFFSHCMYSRCSLSYTKWRRYSPNSSYNVSRACKVGRTLLILNCSGWATTVYSIGRQNFIKLAKHRSLQHCRRDTGMRSAQECFAILQCLLDSQRNNCALKSQHGWPHTHRVVAFRWLAILWLMGQVADCNERACSIQVRKLSCGGASADDCGMTMTHTTYHMASSV